MKKLSALLMALIMIVTINAETLACTTAGSSGTSGGYYVTTSTTTTTESKNVYIYKEVSTKVTTTTTKTVAACKGSAGTVSDGSCGQTPAVCGAGRRCGSVGSNKYCYTVNVTIGGVSMKCKFNTKSGTVTIVKVVSTKCKAITIPRTITWGSNGTFRVTSVSKTCFKGCKSLQSIKWYAQITTFSTTMKYCTRLDEIVFCTNKVTAFTKSSFKGCRKWLYIDCCSVAQYKAVYNVIAYRKDVSIVYGGCYARYAKGCSGSGSAVSKVGANATVKCGTYAKHNQKCCSCYCR